MSDKNAISVHWSFWVVAGATLIWNLLGSINFLSQLSPEAVAAMPEAYQTIIASRPTWATGAFALAVFGGTVGCALLLLKKTMASIVLIASVVGAVGALIPSVITPALPVEALVGGLMQLAVSVFMVWYASLCKKKRWLGESSMQEQIA